MKTLIKIINFLQKSNLIKPLSIITLIQYKQYRLLIYVVCPYRKPYKFPRIPSVTFYTKLFAPLPTKISYRTSFKNRTNRKVKLLTFIRKKSSKISALSKFFMIALKRFILLNCMTNSIIRFYLFSVIIITVNFLLTDRDWLEFKWSIYSYNLTIPNSNTRLITPQ